MEKEIDKEFEEDLKEQVRSTLSEDDLAAIEKLAGEYRMKGHSDEEAEKLAKEGIAKLNKDGEAAFEKFIKKVRLDDIVDDLLRRAIDKFKIKYNKEVPQLQAAGMAASPIDFSLKFKKRTPGKGFAFSALLVLEVKRDGVFETLMSKSIDIQHIKLVKEQATWKFQVYEELLQSIIMSGLTLILLQHDTQRKTTDPTGSYGSRAITTGTNSNPESTLTIDTTTREEVHGALDDPK